MLNSQRSSYKKESFSCITSRVAIIQERELESVVKYGLMEISTLNLLIMAFDKTNFKYKGYDGIRLISDIQINRSLNESGLRTDLHHPVERFLRLYS